jgi:dipeptidase E
MLKLEENKLELIGNRPCRIFKKGQKPIELYAKDDFDFLMD